MQATATAPSPKKGMLVGIVSWNVPGVGCVTTPVKTTPPPLWIVNDVGAGFPLVFVNVTVAPGPRGTCGSPFAPGGAGDVTVTLFGGGPTGVRMTSCVVRAPAVTLTGPAVVAAAFGGLLATGYALTV